jgi:hypothetical protein
MLSKQTVSKLYAALLEAENDCNKQAGKSMCAIVKGHIGKFRQTLKQLGFVEKEATAPAQVPFKDTTPNEQPQPKVEKGVESSVIHQEEVMNKDTKPKRRKPKA